jgi:hypothetical protein
MKQRLLYEEPQEGLLSESGLLRRNFLKRTVGIAGLAVVAGTAGCKKDDKKDMEGGIDLGSGDNGVLNYAYALEQLEAAFYIQVVANAAFTSQFSADEQTLLKDIRDHEVAHREFFKAALGTNAIQSLTVNFSSIQFGERASVLATAKAFEDLGVSAYNGAGNIITNPVYLELAGKIVSVEARHAAYIRDLITNGTFADSTDSNGMDVAMSPKDVVLTANTYLSTKVNANKLG